MQRLRSSWTAFLRDERGVLLAEFLIMLPLLIWGMLAIFVYFDYFQTANVNQKAADQLSDLVSRQTLVTTDFVEGLQEVLTFLTAGEVGARMRVTSFQYDEVNDEFDVLLSCSPGDIVPTVHTSTTLNAMRAQIPTMENLQPMVLIETWVDHQPDFDIGVLNLVAPLEAATMDQTIFTRPRIGRVCFVGPPECEPTCG